MTLYPRQVRNGAVDPLPLCQAHTLAPLPPDSLAERIRVAVAQARRPGRTPDRVWLPEPMLRQLRGELGRPWNWVVSSYDGVPVHRGDVAMVTYASSSAGGHGCILL